MPTLKKIAEHLNISISTVSRALKDHPDVSAETIRRVKELAGMLEYEPNAFAVNLRKQRSDTYAILIPELSGYFYHSFIQAVEEEARKGGYGVMILQSMDDPEIEQNNLKLCRYNHVAGIFMAISSRTKDYTPFQKTEEAGVPIVFMDKVPAGEAFTSVCIADYEAGRLAAQKLAAAGKNRICCIMGSPGLSITQRREKGFLDEWRSEKRSEPEIFYAENEADAFAFIQSRGLKAMQDVGLFCMSDQVLCGAMRGLYHIKAAIPADVSVLAMSNGFMPRFFNPEISFVETSGYQLGKLSFSAMALRHQQQPALSTMVQCGYFEGASI